jgi:hypothetical protein
VSARALIVGLLGLASCIELAGEEPEPPQWRGDVERVIARCAACHDSALATFTGAIECRTPISGALGREDHARVLSEAELQRVRAWIAQAQYATNTAHPIDWAASHGAELKREGYRRLFDDRAGDACARCHDAPVEKGGALPCTTCHETAFAEDRCTFCHGAGDDPAPQPRPCDGGELERAVTALHATHAAPGREYRAVECAACHPVPSQVSSPGHVDTPRADVIVAGEYDRDARACSVPGCHGDRTARWTETSTVQACERCHGDPPATHASDRCWSCHKDAYDGERVLRAAAHLDGTLSVRTDCNGCHDSAFLGSPGAHRGHVEPGPFMLPLSCERCHLVPAALHDPGHIDTALPAEVTLPSFDRESMTCSGAGCHGVLDPVWSEETPSLVCGDCHALPPIGHLPTGTGPCGGCHRTAEGLPITRGVDDITAEGLAEHINGCVNGMEGCRP